MFYMFCSSTRYVLYFLSACSCNLCCDRFLILSHLLVADQLPSADCWALPLSWWLLTGSSCYSICECILIGFRPVDSSPATCRTVSFARICMSAPALWNIRQHAVSAQLPPGTLLTWRLISATVSHQAYNICDVAGVYAHLCIFHQRQYTIRTWSYVCQVHDSNVFTNYHSHLLRAKQALEKQLPELWSEVAGRVKMLASERIYIRYIFCKAKQHIYRNDYSLHTFMW